MNCRSLRAALGIVLTAFCAAAWAQPRSEPNGFTWGELALLPDYCKDAQGIIYFGPGSGAESPRSPQWRGLMGDDFWHVHHYCYGMRNILRHDRDMTIKPHLRKNLLESAINEFNYMIRHCNPQMVLMPEIHYRKGDIELRLGLTGEALTSLQQARLLKPDYWPAYTRWLDVLLETRQFEPAVALAREGLVHVPAHPELVKRLKLAEARTALPPGTGTGPGPR